MPQETPATGRKMSRKEFAAFLKERLPQLSQYPDDKLVEGVLKRRPDLASRLAPENESSEKGIVQRYIESFRSGMGFSPQGGVKEDLGQIWQGLKILRAHPLESGKMLGEGLYNSQKDVYNEGVQRIRQPGGWNKATGAVKLLESGIPLLGPTLNRAGNQFEQGDIAGGFGTMTPILAGEAIKSPAIQNAAVRAADKLPAAARAVKTTATNLPKELMGHGPSMDRLVAAKDINALNIKSEVLAPLEKSVHDDAQATIRSAVNRMEQAAPMVADKNALATSVEKAMGEIAKSTENIPKPLQKLLGGKDVKGVRALSSKELSAAQVAKQLFKEGMSHKEVKSAMNNLGFAPKQVEAILAVSGPEAETGYWGAAELQQVRSDLGRVAFGSAGRSLPGPMRSAAAASYRIVSELMDNIAEKANARTTWRVGNEKWRTYSETFDGKWENGEFHSSPLADALSGQTADEIMGALGRGRLQWTRDLLNRYKQFNPKATDAINRALGRHSRLDMLEQFSRPSKYDVITGGAIALAPGAWEQLALARILTPPLLRMLATRGVELDNVRGFKPIEPGVPGE